MICPCIQQLLRSRQSLCVHHAWTRRHWVCPRKQRSRCSRNNLQTCLQFSNLPMHSATVMQQTKPVCTVCMDQTPFGVSAAHLESQCYQQHAAQAEFAAGHHGLQKKATRHNMMARGLFNPEFLSHHAQHKLHCEIGQLPHLVSLTLCIIQVHYRMERSYADPII